MFEDWLKIRGLWGISVSLIISIISFFIFFVPANNRINNAYDKNSFQMNSELEYCFPEPSKKQIEEFKKKGISNEIFPYYLTQSEVIVGKKNISINILLSESFDNLDFTMYSPDRLISDSSINGDDASYIDYALAKSAGLDIGDEYEVTINNEPIRLIVAKIFEDNLAFPLKFPCVLIKYNGIQKELYNKENTPVIGYKGVFIGKTTTNLQNYIEAYIPEGKLYPREEFPSEEDYNKYTNTIKHDSYVNQIMIYNKDSAERLYKEAKLASFVRSILGMVFIIIFNILFGFILANRKVEISYFKLLQNNKIIKKYRLYSVVFDVTVGMFASIVFCFLFSLTIASYLPGKYINFTIFLMISAYGIGNYLSYKMTQGIYRKRACEIDEKNKFYNEIIEELFKVNPNYKNFDFSFKIIESLIQAIKGEKFDKKEFEKKLEFSKLSIEQIKELCTVVIEIRETEKIFRGLKLKTKIRNWDIKVLICATVIRKTQDAKDKESLLKILDNNNFTNDEKELIFTTLFSSKNIC